MKGQDQQSAPIKLEKSKLRIGLEIAAGIGTLSATLLAGTILSSLHSAYLTKLKRKDAKEFADLFNNDTDLLDKFIVDSNNPQSITQLLMRNALISEKAVNTLEYTALMRAKLAGPWNIDSKSYQLTKDISENINFDSALKCAALDNLDQESLPLLIFSESKLDGNTLGFYKNKNIVVDISNNNLDPKRTITHEFYHRTINLVYRNFSQPYYNKKQKAIFEQVMQDCLTNLHKTLLPKITLPSNVNQLVENLYQESNKFLAAESKIVKTIANIFSYYTKNQYNVEFVVKLPEIIASFGELPPYIRECLAPLEEYYKTEITPKNLEYIANHPRKDVLLPTDHDRYHPETILNRSGEDELLAKNPNKITNQESIILGQIKQMQDFIKNSDTVSAKKLLPDLQDERVVRASLTSCIEHNNLILFNEILQNIKAPQYLGPQLVLAANLNRNEMAQKLLPPITNQYYLAKTIEIASSNTNDQLVNSALKGIKDQWFLERIMKKNDLHNKSIKKAYNTLPSERELAFTFPRIILDSSSLLSPEMDNMVFPLINLDQEKRQRLVEIMKIPEFKEYIGTGYNKMDNLEYLIKLQDTERKKILDIIKIPEFKEYIGTDYKKRNNLEYLIKLQDTEGQKLLDIMKIPEFKEFIVKDKYHQERNLNVLIRMQDSERNNALNLLKILELRQIIEYGQDLEEVAKLPESAQRALHLIKIPEFKEFINHVGNLIALVKLSETEVNTALRALQIPEFKELIDKRGDHLTSFVTKLSNLEDKALNLLKIPEFKDITKIYSYCSVDILQYLVKLEDKDRNKALQMLKDPITKDQFHKAKALQMLKDPITKDQFHKAIDKSIRSGVLQSEHIDAFIKIEPISQVNPAILVPQTINVANALSSPNAQPQLASPTIVTESSAIVAAPAEANYNIAASRMNNIVPQLALSATIMHAASSAINSFSNFFKKDSLNTPAAEVKDIDKKLLSLHEQFKLLHDKRLEKYTHAPNPELMDEINHYKKLQEQAALTLKKLSEFNKLKSTNTEELSKEAKQIWKSYKKLEEAKKLNNINNIAAIDKIAKNLNTAYITEDQSHKTLSRSEKGKTIKTNQL